MGIVLLIGITFAQDVLLHLRQGSPRPMPDLRFRMVLQRFQGDEVHFIVGRHRARPTEGMHVRVQFALNVATLAELVNDTLNERMERAHAFTRRQRWKDAGEMPLSRRSMSSEHGYGIADQRSARR